VSSGKLQLEVVTPARRLLSVEVDELVAPGAEGYFGVRPGHHPFLTTLNTGGVMYVQGGRRSFLAISGGFAEVLGDRVILLCDIAEPAEEIDVQRAQAAEARARQRLEHPPPELDFVRAQAALARAITRLQVARKTIPLPG
jgi:F-type H+-transporting ATPase subunit epsilon